MRRINTFVVRRARRLLPAFWAGVALWMMSTMAAAAQDVKPAPVDAEIYRQRITEIRQMVAAVQDASDEERLARLGAAADDLARIRHVRLPDGAVIPVEPDYLVSRLRAPDADPVELIQIFEQILAADTHTAPPVFDATDLASRLPILAQSRFQYRPRTVPPWLDRLLEQLWTGAERILELLEPLRAVGPALPYVAALLLVALLYFAFRGAFAEFSGDAALTRATPDGELLSREGALTRAQEFSTAGDYRTALRYLYLSTLLILEEHGVLRYDRTLTNREYLADVAHDPALAATLQNVVDVFDRVWYGHQSIDAEEYADYSAAVHALTRYRAP